MSFKSAALTYAECCYTCGRDNQMDIEEKEVVCNHTGRRCRAYNTCGEYIKAVWVGSASLTPKDSLFFKK